MNKSVSTVIKVAIFGALAIMSIIYVFNRSAVESMGTYEKQEMVKPNKTKSTIDLFYSPRPDARRKAEENDDISLTGASGRYNEARIGKSSE